MVEQSEIDVKIDELEILVEEYKKLLPRIADFYNGIDNSSEIINPSIKDSILSALELSRDFSNTFDKDLLIRKCKENKKYGILFLDEVNFIIKNLIEMTKLYRAHDIKYIIQEKSDILSDIKYIFDKINNKISTIVKIRNTDPRFVYEDLIEDIISNEQKIINNYEESIRLVQGIRDQTGTASLIPTNKFFEDTANEYKKSAIIWKWSAIFIFIISFFIAIAFYFDPHESKNYFDIFKIFSYKFIVISILIYGMIFCSKMYIANMHNYTINKHKQNSVLTIINFVESTKVEDKKDIILTFAANCIYSQHETGFNNKSSSDGSNPSDQITKVAEAIGKLASKSSP